MALQPIKRHVIPPAVEGERMRRYSVLLMVGAFALIGLNVNEFNVTNLLRFGASLLANMAIVLATGAVVMRGLQWHYDRLADEFRGIARLASTDMKIPGQEPAKAPPAA